METRPLENFTERSWTSPQLPQKSSELPQEQLRLQITWGNPGNFSVCVLPTKLLLQPSTAETGCQLFGADVYTISAAEVGQGCNILLLMRYFDLSSPFFICFTVLCLTFIHSRQPSRLRDPPFANKFTRKEPMKSSYISGNLNLCKKIHVKHYL